MFKKILIANRGEIAVRVIRACREMGIATVAVFSDADTLALHVRMADEAYHIGGAASADSYLRIDKIIEVAKRSGAEAIHPGYGFLAENANFARALQAAGLTLIGPPPEVMDVMGTKTTARQAAIRAGAPVVPGTTEPLRDGADARQVAEKYGYPVMLKAAAGGGGKGMRLVEDAADIESAFNTAQTEAQAAFGDGAVYLEKAVLRPRHVEIQVFGDTYGNVVHLGERECSIQRRHQKVVEECPSPLNETDDTLRHAMGESAVKIAKSADYVGAGTVEFLVSDITREFYFLEMNTRLQVEHPVTEMVTGIDLVREQILVAAGEPLSFTQEQVSWDGWAIECRVYAEDPAANFMPSPGKITRLRVPQGANVRDDSGIYEGAEISIFYDPMISKFAVWGRTRAEAIDHLRRALREYEVSGIKTTLPFFREIATDEEFVAGRLHTGFIADFTARQAAEPTTTPDQVTLDLALIAAALTQTATQPTPQAAAAPASHWQLAGRRGQLRHW